MFKKITEQFKLHKFLVITLIVLSLFGFIPPFINFVVSTKTPWGFITEDKQDTWINFYGAIIGGGITLAGVAWTIVEQRKQLKEQNSELNNQNLDTLANQYKPHIQIVNTEEIFSGDILNYHETENIKNPYPCIMASDIKVNNGIVFTTMSLVTLKNFGDGEAFISYLDEPMITSSDDINCKLIENSPQNINIKPGFKAILPRHSNAYLAISFQYDYLSSKGNIKVMIPLQYEDQFHRFKYNTILTLTYITTDGKHIELASFKDSLSKQLRITK